MTRSADAPYPPHDLATRVFGIDAWSDPMSVFEEMGAQTRQALLDLLPDDWSWESKRVLDFGCGVGRTLRHFLDEAEQAEIWGADIDPGSIDWLEEHLCPPLKPWRCHSWPPLGLEHGSFDLIWTISVFTHLTHNSFPWLVELHRMLRPGGLLIATYMGRWTSEIMAHEPWEEGRVGMNMLHHDRPWDLGGPAVLMSDWWVREHWGRGFEIVDVTPDFHHMTWVLLRKRDVDLSIEEVERPADDPRELAALRHNVRQVQREVEELRVAQQMELGRRDGDHQRALAECRAQLAEREQALRALEGSLSWRLTKPLRRGG